MIDGIPMVIARPDDPYRGLRIRGVVTGRTTDGARQNRVTFTIRPESISV